jgi:TonB family protein
MRLCLIFLIFGTIPSWCLAVPPESVTLDDALRKDLLLAAPMPDYPYQMRHHHVEGNGLFELKFDYDSGHLHEVHVIQSTGSPMLDGYAIGALKLWKAKPHAVHTVMVPLNFRMSRFR